MICIGLEALALSVHHLQPVDIFVPRPGSPCLAGASLFVGASMPWPESLCLAGVSLFFLLGVAWPVSAFCTGTLLSGQTVVGSIADIFLGPLFSHEISFIIDASAEVLMFL